MGDGENVEGEERWVRLRNQGNPFVVGEGSGGGRVQCHGYFPGTSKKVGLRLPQTNGQGSRGGDFWVGSGWVLESVWVCNLLVVASVGE